MKKQTKDIINKQLLNYIDPNIWIKFGKLTIENKATGLGQGFPDWGPPTFFNEYLNKNNNDPNANHQYNRSFGVPKLVNSISNFYGKCFKRTIDPLKEVSVAPGACNLLFNVMTSLLNEGDEVIVIEPFYETYYASINFMKCKIIGVPLIPPKLRSKEELKKITVDKLCIDMKDEWKFDFDYFEEKLNDKTKLIIFNSPNNPTGKIYRYDEYEKICSIINKKSPNAIIVSDEVYDQIYYDDIKVFPRIANVEGMWEKTVSLYSAGKVFSCTGFRGGWAVGPEYIIKAINSIHQFNAFCMHEPAQNTMADCIDSLDKPYEGFDTYLDWFRNKYNYSRNYMISRLLECNDFFELPEYKMDFYIPEGSYFIVANIKDADVKQLHTMSEDIGKEYTKDFKYCVNMMCEVKVGIIPLSVFYTPENRHMGENYVRISFCKKKETIDDAIEKFKNFKNLKNLS